MVLGLTLIASMAFAQTKVITSQKDKVFSKQATMQEVKAPAVDYKASIFSQSKSFGNNVGDTLEGAFWNFDDMTGMVWDTNGVIQAGEYVRMMDEDSDYAWVRVDMQPHSLSGNANLFMRIPDTSYIRAHSTDYSGFWSINSLIGFVLDRVTTNYMLIYPAGTTVVQTQRHNAFVKLPAIANPGVGNMYEIRFNQNFRKFYDREYIDFKVGSEWYAREINVDGVDADINAWGDGYRSYTMPAEFGQQATLEFRFRLYNPPTSGTTGVRSNAYGYIWALDDVAIVRAPSEAWHHAEQRFTDGGYGTLPYEMNVPLSWYGYIYNDGASTIDEPVATAYHIYNGVATEITSKQADTLLPICGGTQLLTLNERGFYDSIYSIGWFGYAAAWDQPASAIPAGYTRKGLPSDQPGLNKVTVTATAAGLDPVKYDTIAYRVVGETGGTEDLPIFGYRWAHDNGVIASGSRYSYGNVVHNGTTYITPDGHYYQAGYYVGVRFTTPDEIPLDENNEPWVIKGIEIVPQTDTTDTAMVGSIISPLIWRTRYLDSVDAQGEPTQYTYIERMTSEETGISNEYVYEIGYNDINSTINNLGAGYIPAGDNNYHAVNIRVLGQPELEPNTAINVGYYMESDGYFAAAMQQNAYYNAAGQATAFANDDELAPYARQFQPYHWDVIVRDPVSSQMYTGSYHPYWPMIRLVVGQRDEIPTHTITAECSDSNVVQILNDSYMNMCGESTIGYEGGDYTVIVIGAGDSSWAQPGIVDGITIDGRVINLNNEDDYYGDDYTITAVPELLRNAAGEVLLTRDYYMVTFGQIAANHTVSATGHIYPWILGIEGEAVSVSLGMRPNPASHNVTLNMTGVTGMVNCSIIDMSGRVVYSSAINAESSHTIDLSNVAAGAYFVRVTNDSFSKVEKLIVR